MQSVPTLNYSTKIKNIWRRSYIDANTQVSHRQDAHQTENHKKSIKKTKNTTEPSKRKNCHIVIPYIQGYVNITRSFAINMASRYCFKA